MNKQSVALITGVSRKKGIGYSIAKKMAKAGWDLAITYWKKYDEEMPWGSIDGEIESIVNELKSYGINVFPYEADLSDEQTPADIFRKTKNDLGSISALIMSHCYSVDSDIQSTTLESFEKHFAVNTRAVWLLIKEFSSNFSGEFGQGRIIAITSDHTAGNMPYGASKGAMDRIVIAAAEENRNKGITANVVNPGATDTGWMNQELESYIKDSTLLNRIGQPDDCANLIEFLCSDKGGWINGQLLYSNGGALY